MSDKSPRKSMSKKSGKSLKEKRAEKKAKHDARRAPGVHPHEEALAAAGDAVSAEPVETRDLVGGEAQGSGCDVVREVVRVSRAGDRQHMRSLVESPREPDLGGRRVVEACRRQHVRVLRTVDPRMAPRSGDAEERDEGDLQPVRPCCTRR